MPDLDSAIEILRRLEPEAPRSEDENAAFQSLLAEAFAEESAEVFVRCEDVLLRIATTRTNRRRFTNCFGRFTH